MTEENVILRAESPDSSGDGKKDDHFSCPLFDRFEKTTIRTLRCFKLGLGFCGALVIGQPTLADAQAPIVLPTIPPILDIKSYPANGCQQVATGVENTAHFPDGIYNTAFVSTDVICPIVRDNLSNTN